MVRPRRAGKPEAFQYKDLFTNQTRTFAPELGVEAAPVDEAAPVPDDSVAPPNAKRARETFDPTDPQWKDFRRASPDDPKDKTYICMVCESDPKAQAKPIKGNAQTLRGHLDKCQAHALALKKQADALLQDSRPGATTHVRHAMRERAHATVYVPTPPSVLRSGRPVQARRCRIAVFSSDAALSCSRALSADLRFQLLPCVHASK